MIWDASDCLPSRQTEFLGRVAFLVPSSSVTHNTSRVIANMYVSFPLVSFLTAFGTVKYLYCKGQHSSSFLRRFLLLRQTTWCPKTHNQVQAVCLAFWDFLVLSDRLCQSYTEGKQHKSLVFTNKRMHNYWGKTSNFHKNITPVIIPALPPL